MLHRINEWLVLRNEQMKLESMPDRLLLDIGIERADIGRRLRGETTARRTTRPLAARFKSAVIAFVGELRASSDPEYHSDGRAHTPTA